MSEFSTFTLPNGIRCVHRKIKSPVANIAITINAGTRDENQLQHGVAHLVEHLLFKGTARRSAYHVNSLLESVGGELNAFTTKEETVIHASCLKSDYRKGIDLLSDMVFNSAYKEAELFKEREIVIDEINSYKDSPAELIFDDFEELLFANSSLGRNILGNQRNLMKVQREQLLDYIRSTYNTNNIVFSSSASLSHEKFKDLCFKYLSNIPENLREFVRTKPESQPKFEITRNKKTHQIHTILGGYAYAIEDPKRMVLALLINILGGSSSLSRLNQTLREKNAITYNVEANYTPYADTGLFTIYFSSDGDKFNKAKELVIHELDRLKRDLLTSVQLAKAKKQFIGQLLISSENTENLMLSIAKSILVYNDFDSNSTLEAKINTISAEQIREIAIEIFDDDNLNYLIYR